MLGKVLLTGATGFVGRQVLRSLQLDGRAVRIVMRGGQDLPDCDIVRTPDLFAESAAWWAEACADVDTIVHVAWYAEPGKYLPSPRNIDCLTGTLTMAQGAMKAGVRRFVGVGTCFEYDLTPPVLSITTPLRPNTLYGACKASAYLTLSQLLPQAGLSFAWCRLFYLYGEGEDPRRLVPYIRARLSAGELAELTSGQQIRDYLDVAEAGRQIAAVAVGDHVGALNICSGKPITVADLARSIADTYGRRDLLRLGARPDNPEDPQSVLGEPSLPAYASLPNKD